MTSIVIPNYNGEKYLRRCFHSLLKQTDSDFEVLLVDNGSEDGSLTVAQEYEARLCLRIIRLDCNYGFSKAVNEGIARAESEYVILLNNDTCVERRFVEELRLAITREKDVFSAQAMMLRYDKRELLDGAGDCFCAMGWAFSIGKDRPAAYYRKKKEIFSACAGAAIYRKSLVEKLGGFDERFFAYLEDVDLGYRARLHGYRSLYVPSAKVLHIGSGFSGSRYNEFKVRLAARNSLFVVHKNMTAKQIAKMFPFLLAGVLIKTAYFYRKQLGFAYLKGVKDALFSVRKVSKVTDGIDEETLRKIEKELFRNMFLRLQ